MGKIGIKTALFLNLLLIANVTHGMDALLSSWEDCSIFLEHLIVLDNSILGSHQGQWNFDVLERHLYREAKLQGSVFYKNQFSYEELKSAPLPAVLPVRNREYFYVLLNVFEIDGQLRYQLVRDERKPELLDVSKMRSLFKSKLVECWSFTKEPLEGIIRKIGDGAVLINRLYHSFGFINWENLAQPLETSFDITNVGDTSLRVGQVQRSCQCTVAELEPNNIIRPGTTSKLTIKRTPPGRRTLGFRDKITIQLGDISTERKEIFTFEILGNCDGQTIFPVPEEVDFGRIKPGDKAERVVRVSESNTETFRITEVNSDNPAFKTKLDVVHHNELQDYIIHIYFESAGLAPGNINGEILIKTNHPRFAEFNVPVSAEILPLVRAIPSVVSWGLVKLGGSYKKSLQLIPIDEKAKFTIEKIDISSSVKISKKRVDNTLVIEFSKTFDHTGSWQEEAIFHIRCMGETNTIKVPLTGFVED